MLKTIATISIGRPITRSPISLYPLYVHAPAAPHYLTGGEAASAHLLEVEESPLATVPTLLATIVGDVPVLMVEGDVFLGGLQDRVLNTTVLLPAGRSEVPVSCVEAGRWSHGHRFERAGWQAPRHVRSRLIASVSASAAGGWAGHADQHTVWAAVDEALIANHAASDTAALRDAMGERAGKADPVDDALSELAELGPLPEQAGVVAAVGSRFVMAELFDKPTTLRACWRELLAGLADGCELHDDHPPRIDEALRFVRRLRHAHRVELDGVGLGRETRFTRAGQVGSGLEWEGALVHLTTYAVAA